MAKAKKEKQNVEQVIPQITKLEQKRYEDCEWCYKFDDDEPHIFAWTDPEIQKDEDPKVIFTVSNIENSYISFTDKNTGKSFKLFAREISEEGKELRNKQREAFKQSQNGSENQEA